MVFSTIGAKDLVILSRDFGTTAKSWPTAVPAAIQQKVAKTSIIVAKKTLTIDITSRDDYHLSPGKYCGASIKITINQNNATDKIAAFLK